VRFRKGVLNAEGLAFQIKLSREYKEQAKGMVLLAYEASCKQDRDIFSLWNFGVMVKSKFRDVEANETAEYERYTTKKSSIRSSFLSVQQLIDLY
jgi:hypothetical protein